MRIPAIVDEGDYRLNRRSSPGPLPDSGLLANRERGAKYVLAVRKISLARRNSRFPRSSDFSRADNLRDRARPALSIPFGLPHPFIQRLPRAADLDRNREDRVPS